MAFHLRGVSLYQMFDIYMVITSHVYKRTYTHTLQMYTYIHATIYTYYLNIAHTIRSYIELFHHGYNFYNKRSTQLSTIVTSTQTLTVKSQ